MVVITLDCAPTTTGEVEGAMMTMKEVVDEGTTGVTTVIVIEIVAIEKSTEIDDVIVAVAMTTDVVEADINSGDTVRD